MRLTSQLIKLVLLFLLLGICSCGEDVLRGKDLSIPDGETWYAANKKALMELHQFVLQYPQILRVEPAMPIKYIPKSETFTPEDMAAYKEIENICVSMGIKHIKIEREGSDSKGSLISVRYTLSSSGLSVSGGKFICIEFLPDASIVSMLYNDPEYILKPLDEENWYTIDYQESRKQKF